MSILNLELLQLSKSFPPHSFLGVPTKSQATEFHVARVRHMRGLASLEKIEMTSLFLDPQSQFGIVWMIDRNKTVSVLFFEGFQVSHVPFPRSFLSIPCKVHIFQ